MKRGGIPEADVNLDCRIMMKGSLTRIMTALPRRPRSTSQVVGESVSWVVAPSESHFTEASVNGDDAPDPRRVCKMHGK